MRIFVLLLLFLITAKGWTQGNPPWQNALIIVQSNDGINFNSPAIFQDSSGVPCIIQWKGDTLAAVFQWFRLPNPSPSWDRVAVKFSYDNGISWTSPVPIIINGFPSTYQRPFDPTIVVNPDKSILIYYSSSDGMPSTPQAEIINTYSALSTDGIHYNFEPGPRFDHPSNRVIDPAVTRFNNTWHYLAPAGAPQDGAYHALSPDGFTFTQTSIIVSDNTHNWTGNFLADGSLLKFYGSGQSIWYNSSADGVNWNGYTSTNIIGGDPGITRLNNGKYLMVYVGPPNTVTAVTDPRFISSPVIIYPNPAANSITLLGKENKHYPFSFFTAAGSMVLQGNFISKKIISLEALPRGIYLFVVEEDKKMFCTRLVKQ
jgi:hypothetical protein